MNILFIHYISYTLVNQGVCSLYNKQKGGDSMIRLRILDILKEQQHTKYWLYKQMDMSYQNLSRLLNNETSSIKFENLDKLSTILNCPVGDLFEKIEEP